MWRIRLYWKEIGVLLVACKAILMNVLGKGTTRIHQVVLSRVFGMIFTNITAEISASKHNTYSTSNGQSRFWNHGHAFDRHRLVLTACCSNILRCFWSYHTNFWSSFPLQVFYEHQTITQELFWTIEILCDRRSVPQILTSCLFTEPLIRNMVS